MVKSFETKSQTEYDALSSLERDVIKRTQQAQQGKSIELKWI